MITNLAIGDAYGAAFEFAPNDFVRRNNCGTRYHRHPTQNIGVGCYTDDTQMSLAIAETIIARDAWTPLRLATRFVEVYKRDPRPGYAREFQKFLDEVRDGEEFLRRINPRSDKSGAAMRAGPIGIYGDVSEVIQRSTLQSKITHDTPDGIAAGVAAALMSHYCIYDVGNKKDLPAFLNRYVPGYQWERPWRGKVGSQGCVIVRAALTAFTGCNSMTDLLRTCVAFTGDTDTVATVALATAAHCREYRQDLSRTLHYKLEASRYGRHYLAQLDYELLALKKPNRRRWFLF
ncbi:MAG: ADP-ribosylglycohydrolase family protein [Fibrella sp.]|nr:ADP-ribosylglycohydrolase family protein [Armatimonadota bacterium]